jgi:hypothetical protein
MENWQFLISQAIAVLIGAMIPVVTMWIQHAREKRKEAQAWFEKQYIEECLDLLYIHFNEWSLRVGLPSRSASESINRIDFNNLPTTEIGRLSMLLNSDITMRNWLCAMNGLALRTIGQNSTELKITFERQMISMSQRLFELRWQLIQKTIKSKSSIKDIPNLPFVDDFKKAVKEMQDIATKHPSVKKYTANGSQK